MLKLVYFYQSYRTK